MSMPTTSDDKKGLSKTLRINEIFLSIQGESSRSGIPTVFVRLTGCPLRCHYCDTAYAFHEGTTMSLEDILDKVSSLETKYVTVTGGEPLAQKTCFTLLEQLCDLDYLVSLETSGAIDITGVDPRVMKVMDLKTPASGEVERNLYDNLRHINEQDEIKFVICDREDYEWTKSLIDEHDILKKCTILFSPEHGSMAAKQLAEWMLEDKINAKLQVQLHKYLWGDIPGR